MPTAFTPAMKWMIGTLTVAFVALGSWLGYELTKRGTVPKTADATLPAPVTTTLTEPEERQSNETQREQKVEPAETKRTEPAQSPPRPRRVRLATTVTDDAAPTTPSEATLEASVASAATGDQVLVTVAANQPVQVGFDGPSGEYSESRTLTVGAFTGTKTLVVRTRGGQELRFTVTGSSNQTTATTAARS